MKLTGQKWVQAYFVFAFAFLASMFFYGGKYFWDNGAINPSVISKVYELNSTYEVLKKRNDIQEFNKYIEGDRIKDALSVLGRFEADMNAIGTLNLTQDNILSTNEYKKLKAHVLSMDESEDLASLISSVTSRISQFENFAVLNRWPTLSSMSNALRVKSNPTKLIEEGLYHFDKVSYYASSINNDLEALSNFTNSTNLEPNLKMAIINRIDTVKNENEKLVSYVNAHKRYKTNFNEFKKQFSEWNKKIGPKILAKKSSFQGMSNMFYTSMLLYFVTSIFLCALGVVFLLIANSKFKNSLNTKLMEVLREEFDISLEGSVELKKIKKLLKKKDADDLVNQKRYIQSEMQTGAHFQSIFPFPSVMFDGDFNYVWSNDSFNELYKNNTFHDDAQIDYEKVLDFVKLKDQSIILNVLRNNEISKFSFKIDFDRLRYFDVHISSSSIGLKKRFILSFVENTDSVEKHSLVQNKVEHNVLDFVSQLKSYFEVSDQGRNEIENNLMVFFDEEKVGFSPKVCAELKDSTGLLFVEVKKLVSEMNDLDNFLNSQMNLVADIRKTIVEKIEVHTARSNVSEELKTSLTHFIEVRDQIAEEFQLLTFSMRDMFKEHIKLLNIAETYEGKVVEFAKSREKLVEAKKDVLELSLEVNRFKSQFFQSLEQVSLYRSVDDLKSFEQYIAKLQWEFKNFEKIMSMLSSLTQKIHTETLKQENLSTSPKLHFLDQAKEKLQFNKNTFDNIQFAATKTMQISNSRDEALMRIVEEILTLEKDLLAKSKELGHYSGIGKEELKLFIDP